MPNLQDVILDQQQYTSQRVVNRRERAERSIIRQFVASDYDAFYRLKTRILSGLNPNSKQNDLEVMAGMTSSGKSAFTGQLIHDVLKEVQPLYGEQEVPLYTFGLSEAIATARRRNEITSPQGKISVDEYKYVSAALDHIRWTFFQHVPGPAVLLEEANIESERFNAQGQPEGTPRANIASLRNLRQMGLNVSMTFVRASEKFRNKNVELKESMIQVGQGDNYQAIADAQKEVGIIDDRSVGPGLWGTYFYSGNRETSRQQFNDAALQMWLSARDKLYGISFSADLMKLHPGLFVEELRKHPIIFTNNLALHQLGLAEGIMGPENVAMGKVGFFVNKPVPDNLRAEFRGLKDERKLLDFLQRHVTAHPNSALQHSLDYFRLPG